MVLVLEGTLYPVPEASKNWLPYSFLGSGGGNCLARMAEADASEMD